MTKATVIYIERKIVNSLDLLETYDQYRTTTDPLLGYLFDLDLGTMNLHAAKERGREPVDVQKKLETAYRTYFDDHAGLSSDQALGHPHMMTCFTPGFVFDQKLVINHVRNQMHRGLLHMSCCSQQDPTLQQWADVMPQLEIMADYRQELRNYSPYESVMSNRKAEAIKQLVTIQSEKVAAAKLNPGKQDIYATKMLVADLEKLNTYIFTVEQLGLTFRLYKIQA